jgi:hypothetical protein
MTENKGRIFLCGNHPASWVQHPSVSGVEYYL